MKRYLFLALLSLMAAACTPKTRVYTDASLPYTIEQEMIVVQEPERPAGTTDVVQLTCPPIENVRVGFVGLGMRGADAVTRFMQIPGTEIKALCDAEESRARQSMRAVKEAGFPEPAVYAGEQAYKQVCEREDIDLIYIATDWVHHVPVMLYAMDHGKHVACEVPAALNMKDIWDVVRTAERTRKHCMMLENCCYDFFEMTTLNMVQQGLLGEVMHVEGAYIHNLEPYWQEYWKNWRMEYNRTHRGDVYPTHGLGPCCQVLNIHRGDRMEYLTAMDTKAVGALEYLKKQGTPVDTFLNGDHSLTCIRTHNGKTIHIQHNVVSPRPYNRMYQVTGTRGFANKYPIQGFAFDDGTHRFVSEEKRLELMETYRHPLDREIGNLARSVGGHGGMDYVMDYRLVYCLHHGLPLDMDVYDLAEWCCLTELTAISMNHHSMPVRIPDFTGGAWNRVQGYRHAKAQ